jgi:hypothetical protein
MRVTPLERLPGPRWREDANNTVFAAGGTFWSVFTADTGRSITVFAVGPVKGTLGTTDEQAGAVTLVATFIGLSAKLSITKGLTLSRDAGTVTFTDVFEYTGDPEQFSRWLHLQG